MTKIRLTMITPWGDETISEQDLHPVLTFDQQAMSMAQGAMLSGMTIKKVECI